MSAGFSALFTDFYSLTMAQGYWKNNRNNRAVFEMFFRRQPSGGGFSVFAGLETLTEALRDFSFSGEDLAYLDSLGVFEKAFLDYLKDFRFSGSLWAMDEGTIIFPQEPLIRIDSSLIEAQIVEGLILNIINFQSLIATKTARVVLAANSGSVMEFGLRRAQGQDGALSASRAAFIGGAMGTSNVLAGKTFGIPVLGTMSHAWVMSFPNEEDAFRSYAALYPDSTVFLIDTYDTLKSGIHNAIKAGRTLAAAGKNFGVRLDSGDMHYLSVEVRRLLDEAGLSRATITVSNDLDEYIVETLTRANAPIDTWGVGTQMVTGGNDAAFTGVYKLAAKDDGNGILVPAIKFSDNPEKTTNPGIKQVWRIKDEKGLALADIMALEDTENIPEKGKRYAFWHPQADYRHFYHTIPAEGSVEALLKKRLAGDRVLLPSPSLKDIQQKVAKDLKNFDQSYKRLLNPHVYKVSVTEELRTLKLELIKSSLGER
ncbi:MAG: nicotinate phosphoribosyltransferase [Spirochaetaceae bacterium]|jgi:nicotinate phosphoribosyltransferase|nr:nicotinate phosphoribosyltransferase [Spirochaetaceae bacterium]